MKTLDKKAAEILRGLLALQTTIIDNSNGTYMPVHIELIDRTDKYNHISLAHYGQQNGDMMRDPEMLFLLIFETQQFIPYYFVTTTAVSKNIALFRLWRMQDTSTSTLHYKCNTLYSLTNGYAI